MRELCLALLPTERVEFPGSPAERAEAIAAYESERERLRASRFAVELPWADFAIAGWSPEEAAVKVSAERPFRVLGGKLVIFDLDHELLELEAVQGRAELLREGLAKGSLTLGLAFQPAEEEPCPCTMSVAGTYALAVDFLSVELRADSLPVARAVGKGFVPMSREKGVATVEIRAADLSEGAAPAALVDAVQRSEREVLGCFAQALERDSTFDGALVLDLHADASGSVAELSVLADSLPDDAASKCILAAVKQVRAPKSARGALVIELSVAVGQEKKAAVPAGAKEAALPE
ncbi:MAG: AgmX/PglI C-terminal domain-containing protein [Myxococcales bacterium]